MSQPPRSIIGFDRKLELAWLDAMASRLVAGASSAEARQYVWNLLDGVLAGDTSHGARGKTITVLSRVWLLVPAHAEPLREVAARLFSDAPREHRLALHWAMLSAAYPFFVDVAGCAGRLLTLNGELTLGQVVRRIKEDWGDRSTLPRAIQRILRSMVQWGSLTDRAGRGVYGPPKTRILAAGSLGEVLAEGLLLSEGNGLPLDQLRKHPASFPFDLALDANALRAHPRLILHRQGDQTDFIEIKRPSRLLNTHPHVVESFRAVPLGDDP